MNQITNFPQIFNTEIIISISTFMVACAAFFVSWLTYQRDFGRIDFYVGIGVILEGSPLKITSEVIQFRIVNSGRRPLIVSSIGGNSKRGIKDFFLNKFLPNQFPIKAYVINSPEIYNSLLPNGKFLVLNEGDSISIGLPLPKYDDLIEVMALKSHSIYVFDTVGRKHKVPSGVLKKLEKDFIEYKSKKNNAK